MLKIVPFFMKCMVFSFQEGVAKECASTGVHPRNVQGHLSEQILVYMLSFHIGCAYRERL